MKTLSLKQMTRQSLKDKQIGDELIVILIDIHFIWIVGSYTVYDSSEYIKNPTGLENDLSGVMWFGCWSYHNFKVLIISCFA